MKLIQRTETRPMFVEASAIVALLAADREAERFARKLADAKLRYSSVPCVVEAVMRVSILLDIDPLLVETQTQRLLDEADITVLAITAGLAGKAIAAFAAYGEGRPHPAQLTLAQCLSYACAEAYRVPLLFKDGGFARTPIRIA